MHECADALPAILEVMSSPPAPAASSKNALYAGATWLISAFVILSYGMYGYVGGAIPGVEELVQFLGSAEGVYVYVAAFIAIFIEGLYLVGSVFPGTTSIVLLAVLSQIGGTAMFLTTIFTILAGWTLAGAINVTMATLYRHKIAALPQSQQYSVHDHIFTTWFPLIRANYEVQQVVEGANPVKVFLSSFRVKSIASAAAAIGALIIPSFVDVNDISNEEGFLTLGIVSVVSLCVGLYKIHNYNNRQQKDG